MDEGVKTVAEHIESALIAADMAWWELEFPSGALQFSKNKSDMLGRKKEDFVHFSHFTELLHPDDYEKSMAAMRDHYEGRKELYEVSYRIKHADGHYVTFYDRGKIVERTKGSFVVAGIVRLVNET